MAHTFRNPHYRPERLDPKRHHARRKAVRRLDPFADDDGLADAGTSCWPERNIDGTVAQEQNQ